MRSGAKVAIIGGVFTGIVGVAAYGVYNVYDGFAGGVTSATVKTGPPSAEEMKKTAEDFLAAWADGQDGKAAGFTDHETNAMDELTGYRANVHVASLEVTPGTATATAVPFKVTARLDYEGKKSTWTYDSSLTVVRGADGSPLVKWKSAVIHPKLAPGAGLQTGRADTPPVDVLDSDGAALDPGSYPSLVPVLTDLRKRYAAKLGGTPGIETWINAEGGADGETLHVVAEGKAGKLLTTLDADLQAAAEKAVKRKPEASVSVVRPSTGGILAFANNPATANNNAFNAAVAPGSTFKVVTAAALLEHGGITPATAVPCEQYTNYKQGMQFHNVELGQDPDASFAGDFAASCNTAFIDLTGKIGDDALSTEAHDIFGIGQVWNIGVGAFDGKVPSPGGVNDEKAAQMIGQGTIQMSPLNMASVAATAQNGRFLQPHIVDTEIIDGDIAKAPRVLPSGVHQNLKSMLKRTATSGTAQQAMRGLQGDIGGKTGTAERGTSLDAWFLGYRGDVAASALVLEGGAGGANAGPIVNAVLSAAG